jgi:hypothetical protein
MSLLQADKSTKENQKKEKRLLSSKKGNRKKERIRQTAKKENVTKEKTLLDYLNATNDPHLLTCLGLVRLDGRVCVALNGRPIRITDCDNIGCKISVAQGKTTGSRLSIEEPAVNNPYDFPLYPKWKELEGGRMKIYKFAEAALTAYMLSRKGTFALINPNFMFHQEEFRWPQMCTEMSSGDWVKRREAYRLKLEEKRRLVMGRRHRARARADPGHTRKRGGTLEGEAKPRKERKVKEGGKRKERRGKPESLATPTRRSERMTVSPQRLGTWGDMTDLSSLEDDDFMTDEE